MKEFDPWSAASLREEKFSPVDLFTRAVVLLTANHLGVFECLSSRSLALDEIVRRLKTDRKGTRILLDALVALKYLKKSGERYANRSDTARYLIKESPEFVGTMMRHSYRGLNRWLRLEDLVRKGQKYKHHLPEFQRSEAEERKRRKTFALGLDESSRTTAKLIVKKLDLSSAANLLDLGGGAGTYAIEFAKKWPLLSADIFELPVPARVAAEQVKKAGLRKRIRVRRGDFLKDALGRNAYDAVFMSNIIHIYSPENNLKILRKAHRALRREGKIIVKDMIVNGTRTSPFYAVMFALNMFMFTDEGDTYSRPEVTGWLREAGFTRIHHKVVIPHETSMLIGHKT